MFDRTSVGLDIGSKWIKLVAVGRSGDGGQLKTFGQTETPEGLVENGLVNTKNAREALKAGRVYVSGGPEISISLHQKGQVFSLGGAMALGEADLCFTLDHTRRLTQWQGFGLKARRAEIIQNGAPVLSLPLSGDGIEHLQAHLSLWPGWLRLDIIGDYMGKENQLLAFTSPVYVK